MNISLPKKCRAVRVKRNQYKHFSMAERTKKMKIRLFIIAIIMVALLGGCSRPGSPGSDTPDIEARDIRTLALLDMPYELADSSGITVSSFDFGEGVLKNDPGKAC